MPISNADLLQRIEQIEKDLDNWRGQVGGELGILRKDIATVREQIADRLGRLDEQVKANTGYTKQILWLLGVTFVAVLGFISATALGLLHLH